MNKKKKTTKEELTLTLDERNNIRVKKFIDAEKLIAFAKYNKDKKWWNIKSFDYDVFLAGFVAGMNYSKRKTVYEDEKEISSEEEK